MKAYLPSYMNDAGHWIYKGYQNAWQQLGYDIIIPDREKSIATLGSNNSTFLRIPGREDLLSEEYIIMASDHLADNMSSPFLEAAARSYKTFIFAQPNSFPLPWGSHPNFHCNCSDETIQALNDMDNVYLWTFGDVNPEFHYKWKKVHTIPLAFDSISYVPLKYEEFTKYDICYIGGWANNGFDEKRKIMMENFIEFKNSGLNCAFFINKNLTHEQETALLYNSKISLNVHDVYQRVLGYDTNERTFKSLGLNGLLISDKVNQLENIFPSIKTSNDPLELVKITKEYVSLTEKERGDIKEENRQNILDNHCYTNRVEQLLSL
jgi:hypothetical protein